MSHVGLRCILLTLSIISAVQALWVIVPESINPEMIRLRLDGQKAARLKVERPYALWAASLAFARGDLWADSAFTYAELIWNTDADASLQAAAGRATERSLLFSPHRADVWLFLALLSYRFDQNQSQLVSALKMSYYTGANEVHLYPLRLYVSLASGALNDKELQEIVERELRLAVRSGGESRLAIVAAYKDASPTSKKFIETIMAAVDPQFLASIRNEQH